MCGLGSSCAVPVFPGAIPTSCLHGYNHDQAFCSQKAVGIPGESHQQKAPSKDPQHRNPRAFSGSDNWDSTQRRNLTGRGRETIES